MVGSKKENWERFKFEKSCNEAVKSQNSKNKIQTNFNNQFLNSKLLPFQRFLTFERVLQNGFDFENFIRWIVSTRWKGSVKSFMKK